MGLSPGEVPDDGDEGEADEDCGGEVHVVEGDWDEGWHAEERDDKGGPCCQEKLAC